MSCLDEATLLQFLDGDLSLKELGAVEAHLDGCRTCFLLVAAAAQSPPDGSAPRTDVGSRASISPGEVLADRYEIRELIGTGASGYVLRATDRVIAGDIALKILKPELASDPAWMRRLERELSLARQLQHPNVCRVFDLEASGARLFLTMDLATRGSLLADIGAAVGVRPLRQRLADVLAVAEGLAAIHAAGIVHRDIKPENVLRMADGRLVVTDLGLAALRDNASHASVFVGTPSYMAPEVRSGEPATAASDVWSLGVLLHEVVFGVRPRWAGHGLGRKLVPPAEAGPFTVERALYHLCSGCLASSPRRRLADAGAVRDRLRALRRRPARALGGRMRVAGISLAAAALVTAAILRASRNDNHTSAPGVLPSPVLAVGVEPFSAAGVPPSRALGPRVRTAVTAGLARVPHTKIVDLPRNDGRQRPEGLVWIVEGSLGQKLAAGDLHLDAHITFRRADESSSFAFDLSANGNDLPNELSSLARRTELAFRSLRRRHLRRQFAESGSNTETARGYFRSFYDLLEKNDPSNQDGLSRLLRLIREAEPKNVPVRIEQFEILGVTMRLAPRPAWYMKPSIYSQARRDHQVFAELAPGSAWLRLADCHIGLAGLRTSAQPSDSEFEQAGRACDEAARRLPEEPAPLLALASVEDLRCNESNALQALRGAEERDPAAYVREADAWMRLASLWEPEHRRSDLEALYRRSRWTDADLAWADLRSVTTDNMELLPLYRAGLLIRLGRELEAEAELWSLITDRPPRRATLVAVSGLLELYAARRVRPPERLMAVWSQKVKPMVEAFEAGDQPQVLVSIIEPLAWVSPKRAHTLMGALRRPTTCAGAMAMARLYHAMGDADLRDQALAECSANWVWTRQCRRLLGGRPARSAAL